MSDIYTDTSDWNRLELKNSEDYTFKIKNNNTGTEIEFPVMPQGLSETISSTFNQQEIIGASRPRIVYSSTSAKTMNFSLQSLTEDYVPSGFKTKGLYAFVREIQSLAYPEYNGGVVKPPDLTLYLGDRTMDCVCTNVSVSWGTLTIEQQIKSCDIDISLLMTRNNVPGATWIMEKG